MSNLKRFLALTLAMIMIVSGMALNVTAAFPDVRDEALALAIAELVDQGIIKGRTDGTFGGTDNVTRQEFAMFVARIRSANPGLFDTDKGSTRFDDNELMWPDARAAVAYCVSEGIVNGVGWYMHDGVAYANGFNPLGNITFQDAVTMLSRALGYTTPSYPFGFLTNAQNKDVGLFGTDAAGGFAISGAADRIITRNEMAQLLWNFYNSSYVKFDMIPVPGGGWREGEPQLTKVRASFGTEEAETVIGYIVGIPNWAITLDIADYKDGLGVKFDDAKFADPESRRNPHDLVIGTGVPVKNLKDEIISYVDKTTEIDGYITASRAVLGFTESFDELLGLKVELQMVDDKITAAKVVGKKTEVDLSKATATVDRDNDNGGRITDNWRVRGLTLAKEYKSFGITNASDFDWTTNLYTFGASHDSTKLVAADVAGARFRDFAQFVDNKGNYRLEYVNNGIDSEDFDEFFYVFRPFSAGYYKEVKDEWVDWWGPHHFMTTANNVEQNAIPIARANSDTRIRVMEGKDWVVLGEGETLANYFAPGSAYLYTQYFIEGTHNYIDVYGKLTPVTGATVAARSGDRITFRIPVPATATAAATTRTQNYNFNFLGTQSKARNVAVGAAALATGHTFTLFLDAAGDPLVIWRTVEGGAVGNTNYAIVLEAIGPIVVNNEAFIATRIFDAQSGSARVINVNKVDGSTANVQTAVGNRVGQAVALLDNEKELATFGNNNFTTGKEYTAGLVDKTTGTAGVVPAAPETANESNVGSIIVGSTLNLLNGSGSWIPARVSRATKANTGLGGYVAASSANATAVINSATKIIVYSLDEDAGTPAPSAKVHSADNLRRALDSTSSTPGWRRDLIVVGNEDAPNSARYVFLTIQNGHGTIEPATVANLEFGVVRSANGFDLRADNNNEIYLYKVGVYNDDGVLEEKDIHSSVANLVGSFVRLRAEERVGVSATYATTADVVATTFGNLLQNTGSTTSNTNNTVNNAGGEIFRDVLLDAADNAVDGTATGTSGNVNITRTIGEVTALSNSAIVMNVGDGAGAFESKVFAVNANNAARLITFAGTEGKIGENNDDEDVLTTNRVTAIELDQGDNKLRLHIDQYNAWKAASAKVYAVMYTDTATGKILGITLIRETSAPVAP